MFEYDRLRTAEVHGQFREGWERQLKKPKPDIRIAILRGNVKTFVWTGILYAISTAMQLAGPLLLTQIVGGLSCFASQVYNPELVCASRSSLYYFCIGLLVAPLIQSLCENIYTFKLSVLGTRMRNALMAEIYRKTLRLSNSAIQSESTGRVVTLMSNDAQKVQDSLFAIHSLWGSPLLIIVILVLLYRVVQWATFVGLGVMLLLIPITAKLSVHLAMLRRSLLKWTDKRVGLMNEVVNGMLMIKFYAWEDSFKKDVMECRGEEAKILKTVVKWQGLFGMFLFSGPVLVAIFCFGSYVVAGNTLTATGAYTALALFALLRFPMSFLPMFITMIVNALVGLKRIQTFLSKAESDPISNDEEVAPGVVRVVDGEFTWDESLEHSTLTDINLEAQPGSLTMVVGAVGSGKSSVLNALIGFMTKRKGKVSCGGKLAYVAQTAWIINDTVKENVLMGAEMDPDKYATALECAQLGPDLEILPNGDNTEIGDRGVTLSGGQKQRVSMARALYAGADVYLLDDPLSAVDSHVGRAMFEQCIRDQLRNKTVVLVTNALQYLPQADHVVWMDNGVVRGQGTYQELVKQGMNIAELAHVEDVPEGEGKGSKLKGEPRKTDSKKLMAGVSFNRGNSITNRNLTGVESREEGSVSGEVLMSYVRAGGGWLVVALVVVLIVAEQCNRVVNDLWVGFWAVDLFTQGVWFYLGIYFALGMSYGLFTYLRALNFLYATVNASLSLHNQLLAHLLRLPKAFFDTNPAGRILNRFSRDVDIMDSTLPQSMIQFVGSFSTYISILIVISITTKWFAIALVPVTVIYVLLQRYYIPTARELQRLESISRSPIYARFGEAMLGVATIRSYRKEAHFTRESDRMMEDNAFAFVTQKAVAAWLAMRLDLIGTFILCFSGVLCIQGAISPELAGLCLVYALDLTRFLKFSTTMASKTESDFNSVERVVEYLKPDTEAAHETPKEVAQKLPEGWPAKGELEVVKLQMRYREGLPLVLKGISFHVSGGEKVGVVGRTGSGKSSLFMVLFRMVEPTGGTVSIDGVDTAKLGLSLLRSSMSIIPQDPFMFSGSVRHNLDPFERHNDAELWEVLRDVNLKHVISELEDKLGAKVMDNGANFSQGQKQLFCLARAMLRRSRLLMMDEATASVDPETDGAIQLAIRSTFKDCTLLTIAHRLNTIMDNDRVLVLDHGVVAEYGEPHELLQQNEGIFTGMVVQTGSSSSRYLRDIAQRSSLMRSAKHSASAASLHALEEEGYAEGKEEGKGKGAVIVANASGGDMVAPPPPGDDGASGSGSGAGDVVSPPASSSGEDTPSHGQPASPVATAAVGMAAAAEEGGGKTGLGAPLDVVLPIASPVVGEATDSVDVAEGEGAETNAAKP